MWGASDLSTFVVVPTHVGVNRPHLLRVLRPHRCPHARGGEPGRVEPDSQAEMVVPTHVGVNRRRQMTGLIPSRVVPTHVGVNREHRHPVAPWPALSPRTWG